MKRLITLLAALALATALVACGDDDEGGSSDEQVEASADPGTTDGSTQPEVTVPDEPVTELEVTDLVEGDGEEVRPGAVVTAHYVGVSQATGQEFDSSWSRGEPATFPLDQVIQGWSEGLVGMKVGGRRELVIPGEMAYGATPPSPDIAANDTLVFVVDLVDVQNP